MAQRSFTLRLEEGLVDEARRLYLKRHNKEFNGYGDQQELFTEALTQYVNGTEKKKEK